MLDKKSQSAGGRWEGRGFMPWRERVRVCQICAGSRVWGSRRRGRSQPACVVRWREVPAPPATHPGPDAQGWGCRAASDHQGLALDVRGSCWALHACRRDWTCGGKHSSEKVLSCHTAKWIIRSRSMATQLAHGHFCSLCCRPAIGSMSFEFAVKSLTN